MRKCHQWMLYPGQSMLFVTSLYTAGRLRNVNIGVTDVTPVPMTWMSPEEFNLTQCAFIEPALALAEVRRVECPHGGVTGRYLVVQMHYSQPLLLCEVTAERRKFTV